MSLSSQSCSFGSSIPPIAYEDDDDAPPSWTTTIAINANVTAEPPNANGAKYGDGHATIRTARNGGPDGTDFDADESRLAGTA